MCTLFVHSLPTFDWLVPTNWTTLNKRNDEYFIKNSCKQLNRPDETKIKARQPNHTAPPRVVSLPTLLTFDKYTTTHHTTPPPWLRFWYSCPEAVPSILRVASIISCCCFCGSVVLRWRLEPPTKNLVFQKVRILLSLAAAAGADNKTATNDTVFYPLEAPSELRNKTFRFPSTQTFYQLTSANTH